MGDAEGFWASCCGGLFARRSNSDEAEDIGGRSNPLVDADGEVDGQDICEKISRLARENPGNIALNTFEAGYYNSLQGSDKSAFLKCLNSVRCLILG